MNKTKLILQDHLDGHKITELAKHMDVTYTQLYQYLKDDANPTLSMLDRLAKGLSKMKGQKVNVIELLEIDGFRYEAD